MEHTESINNKPRVNSLLVEPVAQISKNSGFREAPPTWIHAEISFSVLYKCERIKTRFIDIIWNRIIKSLMNNEKAHIVYQKPVDIRQNSESCWEMRSKKHELQRLSVKQVLGINHRLCAHGRSRTVSWSVVMTVCALICIFYFNQKPLAELPVTEPLNYEKR